MNNKPNTAKAPYIKHDSPQIKDVVNFADRFWYVLELKKKKLSTIMQKSDNHLDADMAMIRIQALEWVQGIIQDIILNNVTRDWPAYNYDKPTLPLRFVKIGGYLIIETKVFKWAFCRYIFEVRTPVTDYELFPMNYFYQVTSTDIWWDEAAMKDFVLENKENIYYVFINRIMQCS